MNKTIIFKILLMFSIIIVVVFGVSNYAMFKNNEKIIRDVHKNSMDNIEKALNTIGADIERLDKEKIKKHIEVMSRYSSQYLQNFDQEGLKDILSKDVLKKHIKLIQIWDNDLDELFLMYFIENNKVIFGTKIPKEFEKFEKIKAPISVTIMGTPSIIGEITAYHDKSHIIEEVKALKKESTKEIIALNIETNHRLNTFIKNTLMIYLMSLIISLIAMALILRKLINNPLIKLQSGLNDFFLFIQKKKDDIDQINIRSKDEFQEMAHSLNESIEVSSKIFEDIYQLNTALKEKTKKEKTLLDNASQGFLTFDKSFIIDNEYSIKCEEILGLNIANKNILDILFLKDNENINKNKKMLLDALSMDNKIAQTSILTLLPRDIIVNKMYLMLEYRIIEDNKFMLIITNQSKQKKLESRIQKEQNILKMIVAVVQDSNTFYDVKKDFEHFTKSKANHINSKKSPLDNLSDLYRTIHTFKGTFLQLFMSDTVDKLHKVESQFSSFISHAEQRTNKEISNFIDGADFNSFMDHDLDNISKLLGKEFVHNDHYIMVDGDTIKDIKHSYSSLLESFSIENKLSKDIFNNIISLLQKPLLLQLGHYPKLVMRLARELEKEVYEFEVTGSRDVIVPEDFKPFINSLVHVFRNSVDHGIETAEERIVLNKDIIGSITCDFSVFNDNLQIVISDDGAGIDVHKIKAKISKEVDVSKLSNADIHLYIFQEHMSTKNEITEISGRGIGMGAVKAEIEKLDGTIAIKSEINVGTTFIFNIPLKKER